VAVAVLDARSALGSPSACNVCTAHMRVWCCAGVGRVHLEQKRAAVPPAFLDMKLGQQTR